jgi:hypothetical protein
MRIGRRVGKVVFWGLVLCLSILAGGLWFAYTYVTDSETAARLVKHYALRYLPRADVEPGRVRIGLFRGELTLYQLNVWQKIDAAPFVALRIPWLHIGINPRKLIRGQLDLREVVVVQPALRLRRRRDGTWNLQGLLADPWPGPWLENTPPILIQDGTLELTPDDEPAGAATDPSPGSPAVRTPTAPGPEPEPAAAVAESAPAKPAGGAGRGAAILREVSLKIEQAGRFVFRFAGSARGDLLDRVQFSGTIDFQTGRIELGGDLYGLNLTEALRRRIPREVRPAMRTLALNSGVVDVEGCRIRYDPGAVPGNRLHYAARARLRGGVWECAHLPFKVNDLSAAVAVEDGLLTIARAEGSNGSTTLRAAGTIGIGDPRRAPMDLRVELIDLQLDQRLRDRTPREYDELWDVFQPRGRVGAEVHVVRSRPGGSVELGAKVTCRDVAAKYRHFPYQLDHLTGQLTLEKNLLAVDLRTSSVGGPLHLWGTIEEPGVDAVVRLEIQADSVPIDKALLDALPPDVRKVVDQFRPGGTVKAHASVFRRPMEGPDARPEGLIAIDAEIDLSERCEITWTGLPFPVRNLTGRLELHPDRWVFRDMRGRNGQAVITASGSVEKLPGGPLANGEEPLHVRVDLQAQNLPFGEELRKALPDEWQKAWRTINPSGACDVEAATVDVEPSRQRTHIVVVPRPESNVRLEVTRASQPGFDPGGTFDLRMEDVLGRFIFDDGVVTMSDVSVQFRGAPVRFAHGTVFVEDTGRFGLAVDDLWVKDIRLDVDLRLKMPPLMAQFAQRVDDGKTFTARGNLKIGWSGVPGKPAWCQWDKTLVVLNDHTLKTGIPLEHIQGELDDVSGWSNGQGLRVSGIMRLESVVLLGQQMTKVESPFRVEGGVATLVDLRGRLLGGELWSQGWVSLAATPRYAASLSLHGAQLEEYARTLGGRQSFRGRIDARLDCNGLGNDIHTLEGRGEAHISQGHLGELPVVLRLASILPRAFSDSPRVKMKTAFDSADIAFTISHGLSTLEPIKFTGNAFSLQGRGTLDPMANLDLRLKVLLGRDRWHVPLLSDLTREASAQFFIVHVTGTPAYPHFKPEALPQIKRDGGRLFERREQSSP